MSQRNIGQGKVVQGNVRLTNRGFLSSGYNFPVAGWLQFQLKSRAVSLNLVSLTLEKLREILYTQLDPPRASLFPAFPALPILDCRLLPVEPIQ